MMTWTKRLFALIVMLPGLLFVIMGLRWLVDPAGIAPSLGLTLETGFGLSSQVGDLSAFFLVAGLSILIALITRTRSWYYPPVMLLLIAATGRLISGRSLKISCSCKATVAVAITSFFDCAFATGKPAMM